MHVYIIAVRNCPTANTALRRCREMVPQDAGTLRLATPVIGYFGSACGPRPRRPRPRPSRWFCERASTYNFDPIVFKFGVGICYGKGTKPIVFCGNPESKMRVVEFIMLYDNNTAYSPYLIQPGPSWYKLILVLGCMISMKLYSRWPPAAILNFPSLTICQKRTPIERKVSKFGASGYKLILVLNCMRAMEPMVDRYQWSTP